MYYHLGQLAAMALTHGGGAINILSPSTYNFMCGMKPSDIVVNGDEITDSDARMITDKVLVGIISEVSR